MGKLELIILAIGLSMDAFAVAVCKGLAMKKLKMKDALIVGLWFGAFQALMPAIGYLLGIKLRVYIEALDHWIAFLLLAVIGANMIKESFGKDDEDVKADLSFKTMLLMAIATSIDALAVGITFACLGTGIVFPAAVIGMTTFIISVIGVKIGNVFGVKYKSKAELAGGIILILIGLKILLEHLGVISF